MNKLISKLILSIKTFYIIFIINKFFIFIYCLTANFDRCKTFIKFLINVFHGFIEILFIVYIVQLYEVYIIQLYEIIFFI